MNDVPQIRASYAQLLLQRISALPNGPEILAHVDPKSIALVADEHRLAFIDAVHHQALLDAASEELDGAALLDLLLRQTRLFSDSPLVAATLRTLLSLTGRSPHTVLKHFPRLRNVAVRNFGLLTYASNGAKSARFSLIGYPAQYMNDTNVILFRATFLAMVDITGDTGDAVFMSDDKPAGAAEYEVNW